MKQIPKIVDFLFEVGMLAKTPRSGFHFLGSGDQSVAEHINRMCFVGMALGHMHGKANVEKILKMCLYHDLGEARVSDLNYVHQLYVDRKEREAIHDMFEDVPFNGDAHAAFDEYEAQETIEAELTKDADNIELLLTLKELVDTGNPRGKSWAGPIIQRMKTSEGKMLAKKVMTTASDHWWFGMKKYRGAKE